jgi:hypothetical protein
MRETGSKLDKNKRLANLPKGFGIEWISRRKFSLSDYTFNIAVSFNTLSRSVPIKDNYADNVFFLLKTTDIIQRYLHFGLLDSAPDQELQDYLNSIG